MAPEHAVQIQGLIDGMSFPALQHQLQAAGQGQSVPDAMLFVSDLSVIASLSLAGQDARVEALLDNDLRSNRARRLAVIAQGGCDTGVGSEDAAAGMQDTASGSRVAEEIGGKRVRSDKGKRDAELKLARVGGGSVAAAEAHFDMRRLMMVIFALVFFCAMLPVLHFAVVWARVVRRRRKTCKIPARVSISLSEMSGHILVLGKLGCTFMPDTDPDEDLRALMQSGMFCTVEVGDRSFSAKLGRKLDESCGIRFSEPLDTAILTMLFKLSHTPPKADVVRDATGTDRPWSPGYGNLTRASESADSKGPQPFDSPA